MMYAAFLRGINVGGHKAVAMSELRDALVTLGFTDVRTLLQSGNVVFGATERSAAKIEHKLQAECPKRLRLDADFFVRSAAELQAIVGRNPFRDEAARDPGHLLVMLLKDAPTPARIKALEAAIVGREIVRAEGRHAYIVYPDGVGRSRLTHALIEKTLGTRATGRNWNTIVKLNALTAPPQ